MEFKDLVKKRREQLNLTMEELGNKVGVSKATVQRWESGEIKNVRRDKITKLADALETSPAYLMGWDDEHDDSKQVSNMIFSDPQEAMLFIIKNPIMMAYGGYDIQKMSDKELIDFANQIAEYMAFLAQKYSR